MYFSTIEQLLHPMIKLAHLLIVASGVYHDMSDGTEWERILAKITSFKFLFTFHKSTWVEEPIKLDSFRSLFWLKKNNGMLDMIDVLLVDSHYFIQFLILGILIHGVILKDLSTQSQPDHEYYH